MNSVDFVSQLEPSDLVLTANRRLSNYLRLKYDQSKIELNCDIWSSLTVMPLQSWIDDLYLNYSNDSRIILSDFQELLLWEQIASRSAAKLAKDAWKLINHWLLNLNEIKDDYSNDVIAFKNFAVQFQSECVKKNVLSRSELLPILIKLLAIESAALNLPSKIYFVGFEELTPAMQTFQTALQARSIVENIHFSLSKKSTIQRQSFKNKNDQFRAMARWAYQELKINQHSLIGCVLPNLTENRNDIIHCFEEVYYSERLSDKNLLPSYNISAGKMLNDYPIIQVVLLILSLPQAEIDINDLSALLKTPYVKGGQSEINQRAVLDVKLRYLSEKKISLDNFIGQYAKQLENCYIFSNLLKQFVTIIIDFEKKFSFKYWVDSFVKLLNALGWPGDRSLTSIEYQLVERFKKTLTEFISLQLILTEVNYSDAVRFFKNILNMTLFQPKSDDSPIQILGVLEASGIQFDALWIAELNDEIWPAQPSPNPFIPVAIQRTLNMPHASSQRELNFSMKITDQFIQNSKKLIVSHAEFDGDRPLSPSSLIINYQLIEKEIFFSKSIAEIIFDSKNLEEYIDDVGPAIVENHIKGGSGIFKSQAACPFQAFATYRLNAQPIDEAQIGLAMHERGSLIHNILASIWLDLKNHQTLCALSDTALSELLMVHIDKSLINISQKKPIILRHNFLALEKQRLHKLLFRWLQLEKKRAPFEVIACEQRQSAVIGKLNIHVQIDRVDQFDNGELAIIDYKTGRTSLSDWFSERPNEPQLPLYSLITQQTLGSVLFAQIRQDDLTFKGITSHPDLLPGTIAIDKLKESDCDSLLSLIDYWKIHLEKLALDFCEGQAQVDPKDSSTCQYCQLQSLCRIDSVGK